LHSIPSHSTPLHADAQNAKICKYSIERFRRRERSRVAENKQSRDRKIFQYPIMSEIESKANHARKGGICEETSRGLLGELNRNLMCVQGVVIRLLGVREV